MAYPEVLLQSSRLRNAYVRDGAEIMLGTSHAFRLLTREGVKETQLFNKKEWRQHREAL